MHFHRSTSRLTRGALVLQNYLYDIRRYIPLICMLPVLAELQQMPSCNIASVVTLIPCRFFRLRQLACLLPPAVQLKVSNGNKRCLQKVLLTRGDARTSLPRELHDAQCYERLSLQKLKYASRCRAKTRSNTRDVKSLARMVAYLAISLYPGIHI